MQLLLNKIFAWQEENECNDEHDLMGTMGSNLSSGNFKRFLDIYEEKLTKYFECSQDVYEEALNTMSVPKILRLFNRIAKSK